MFDGKITEKKARQRKPNPGTSTILIDSLEMMVTQDHGTIPKMVGRVFESSVDQVGAEVGDVWFIHDGTELQRSYTRGDVLAFSRAVAGSLGHDASDTEKVKQIGDALFRNEEYQKTQPARGLALKATVTQVFNKDGTPRTTKKGELLMNVSYAAVPHTPEQIKAQRDQLEAWKAGRVPVAAGPAPVVAPTVAPAPAPVTSPVPAAEPPPPAPTASLPAGGLLAGLKL